MDAVLNEYIERNAAITTALDAVEIHPSQVGCLKEALSEIPAAAVVPVTRFPTRLMKRCGFWTL